MSCCLPCNHCSHWTWVVEEILAFANRLRSTHCREFHYKDRQKLRMGERWINRRREKVDNRWGEIEIDQYRVKETDRNTSSVEICSGVNCTLAPTLV